jgi:hypothetical protein
VRSRVVAFSYEETWTRGLAASDEWRYLSHDPFEKNAPIYDTRSQTLVTLTASSDTVNPRRLDSTSSVWKGDLVGPGPGPDVQATFTPAYDSLRDRMLVYTELGWDDERGNDVWALNLAGAPAWTKLAPEGSGPSARVQVAAHYDPVERRLLVFGGVSGRSFSEDDPLTYHADVWSLDLEGESGWTELSPAGNGPVALGTAMGRPAAFYDQENRRMIIVVSGISRSAVRVFALDLEGTVTWHEFCSPGATPFSTFLHRNTVLAGDRLYLEDQGAAFWFNLATPYCDG